jgi:homogentisate 1,2-dioxygenase
MIGVTDWGLEKCQKVQTDYNAESWEPLKSHFRLKPGQKIDNGVKAVESGTEGDKAQVPHYT